MAKEVINNAEWTRADKLYALTGAMLIREAEKLGVKVRKHGNALKESKDSVISKILAKEAELAGEVIDGAPEVESVETVSAETESSDTSQPDSDEDVVTVEVPKVEADVEVQETEAPASTDTTKEKRTRRRRRKTFEGLIADIPASANLRFVKSKKGGVRVFLGERRLFYYNGTRILTNNESLFAGLDYTEKSYGYKYFCKPTAENFLAIFNNI